MLATVHMKKNVIVRSNREYDYFSNVLEYEYDSFASYSSTSTQKVLVLEYEYKYMCTITPSLITMQWRKRRESRSTNQKAAVARL